jgi:hypothetical protein
MYIPGTWQSCTLPVLSVRQCVSARIFLERHERGDEYNN